MNSNHLLLSVALLNLLIFSSVTYAQEPQSVENPPIADVLPPQIEDPSQPSQKEQICDPVRPDELEWASGDELIQHWLNYAECEGVDIDQIPEPKLLECGPGDYKCEEINKRRMEEYAPELTVWFMSSHSITLSKGLDPELEEYMKKVPQNHLAPIIIQLNRNTSIAEMIELINLGLRYYRGSALQNAAYLTFVPVSSINEIANKSYIAGVTLFKPSFKYTKIPATENKIETHVYTIEESKPSHESDLKKIGIDVVHYDDTLKLYVVKMSSSQYDEVANLEWSKLITVVPASMPESELIEATDKANNYSISDSIAQESNNSSLIIYAIAGIVIVIAFMLFIKRKTYL